MADGGARRTCSRACARAAHEEGPIMRRARGVRAAVRAIAAAGTAAALCAASLPGMAGAAWAGPAAPDGPGKVFSPEKGTKIWYDVRGTAAGRPLVMVNGGPGFDHQ